MTVRVTDNRKLTPAQQYEAEVAIGYGRWPWQSLGQLVAAADAEEAARRAWLREVCYRLGLIVREEEKTSRLA